MRALSIVVACLAALSLVACGEPQNTAGADASNGSPDGGGQRPDAGSTGPKRIFVTSTGYTGNFRATGSGADGLDGADKLCGFAAQAANLGGTWKAWISDSTTNAVDRIADVGPWYLLDGTKVFNNKANLHTQPLVPINVDENGRTLTGTNFRVWTGTLVGGAHASYVCQDWTYGNAGYNGHYGYWNSTTDWTYRTYDYCDLTGRLYCLEQ